MPKNRYQLMRKSETEKDSNGNLWPDPLTIPIENFETTALPIIYDLSSIDLQRIDFFVASYYGTPEYDDILLWYNNIPWVFDASVGDSIDLFLKKDIESFYAENTV